MLSLSKLHFQTVQLCLLFICWCLRNCTEDKIAERIYAGIIVDFGGTLTLPHSSTSIYMPTQPELWWTVYTGCVHDFIPERRYFQHIKDKPLTDILIPYSHGSPSSNTIVVEWGVHLEGRPMQKQILQTLLYLLLE